MPKRGISEANSRRQIKEETRIKLSNATSGENNPMFGRRGKDSPLYGRFIGDKNPMWRGGVSFEPYCVKFNREFKNRVRAFFGYRCVECGKTTEENGQLLSVHHVNYDKMMCCNDVKPLFVALCRSHNIIANGNREYWEQHYTDIINNRYGGQCYFPKDYCP